MHKNATNVTETTAVYTQSVSPLSCHVMPFGIYFHPTRLKQFEPKPRGLKVLYDYLWMSPEYTQQTLVFFVFVFFCFVFFVFSTTLILLFFILRANIIWHILETHLMEEREKKQKSKLKH